jgi:hypothetical protein
VSALFQPSSSQEDVEIVTEGLLTFVSRFPGDGAGVEGTIIVGWAVIDGDGGKDPTSAQQRKKLLEVASEHESLVANPDDP